MKKLFNYMLVIGLTFMASIGLAKAADYDLSFKFYELTGDPDLFVEEVYNVGNAVEIDPLKLKAGQEFALAVYSKSNTGLAEGFNIDVIWDDSVLEPWRSETDEAYTTASVDFETGIYPLTIDKKGNSKASWGTVGDKMMFIDYYVINGNNQIPQFSTSFYTSGGSSCRLTQDGVLFWLYFKVKDNVSPGTKFNFAIGPDTKAISDGGDTSLVVNNQYGNCLVNNSTEDFIVKGDINNNGRVDIGDSLLVVSYVLNKKVPNERQFTAADVNNDGKINISDSLLINNYLLKKITSF